MPNRFAGFAVVALLSCSPPALCQDTGLLTIGVTGSASGSGASNPFVLLNDPTIARLVLDAARAPVTQAQIEAALAEAALEARLADLVETGVFRAEADGYVLAFDLFTIEDQLRLDALSNRYGGSLADAILAHHDELDALLGNYRLEGVDQQTLAYILIGCFSLDWDGLDLTEARGWRIAARAKANGDVYALWARENGPQASLRGYYWGSHNSYFDDVVLTSFGDHDTVRFALPDLTWRMMGALNAMETGRDIRWAAMDAMEPRADALMIEAGCLMLTLRDGPLDMAGLAAACTGDRTDLTLGLLEAVGYAMPDSDGRWSARILVLTERDRATVDGVRRLIHDVTGEWLEANYEAIRAEAADLTPSRFGVPYDESFTQIWHYLFGAANRELVARGYFIDPYRETTPWPGYVPVVWDPSLSAYR